MRRKTPPQEKPKSELRHCSIPGCPAEGEYKAPKSKSQLNEYHWLCLDHIRDYNKAWNYFEGMDQPQIEAFMKDAVTGHRPTWKLSDRVGLTYEEIEAGIARMFGEKAPKKKAPTSDPKERKALASLDLEERPTLTLLKSHYKKLVKKHHPDVNKGDKKSEEKFKSIAIAYKYLLQIYK